LRVAVPAGLSAEARLVILDDRRGAPGSTESFDVPYRERYQVPFRLAYHPNDRIQLSTTSTWVSSRRVALTEDTTLPAYWLIDAELEYRLVPAMGLVVSGKNLTDRKYSVWQGYPATGVLISGGVTARW
jgi:outer membrane receptor protein involved in Fe transport